MPQERKTFATHAKYWIGRFQDARRELKLGAFFRAPLAVMIGALFKLSSGFGTAKDVLWGFFYVAAAYGLLLTLELLGRWVLFAPVKHARELESRIADLSEEKTAREADVPRLKIVSPKNEQTWQKRDSAYWLCRIVVKNLCQSSAAEGVKVKVQKVSPYKFQVNPLPLYLVRKGRYGAAAGTLERLGPLDEELFDLLLWDDHSNFGLQVTEIYGPMVPLKNRTEFPANECELSLEASGDNCTPVSARFKLRWNGQEMAVDQIP